MRNVYVVTEGEYSDYHIVAVCENEEVAKKIAEVIGGEVESFPFNTFVPKIYRYRCHISKKAGKVLGVCEEVSLEQDLGTGCCGDFYGRGATKEEAIKNTRDYRAKCMAQEAGL